MYGVLKGVQSFSVNHMILEPGIYLRNVVRVGLFSKINIWDFRITKPNRESAIPPRVMHVFEHMFAFYLRELIPDKIVSVNGMFCCTGFYIEAKSSVAGIDIASAIVKICKDKFPLLSNKEIPGATPEQCGNYKYMDFKKANVWASTIVERFQPIFDAYREEVIRGRQILTDIKFQSLLSVEP